MPRRTPVIKQPRNKENCRTKHFKNLDKALFTLSRLSVSLTQKRKVKLSLNKITAFEIFVSNTSSKLGATI